MATTTATTVGTTAGVLGGFPLSYVTPGGQTVVISNVGANALYVGGPGVTTATGVVIAANGNLVLPGAAANAPLFAVAATGGTTAVVGVF